MKLNSYLVKNRLGTFYIRLQRNGLDKRISLRTKNKSEAIIAALHFNAQINMTRRTLGWGCDTRSDGTFSFTTDENDKADNFQSAERALEIIAKNYAQPKLVPQQAQQIQPI